MNNVPRPEPGSRVGVAAVWAAVGIFAAPTVVCAQVRLQIDQVLQPMIGGAFFPQAMATAGDAIGDPWWDEAEAKQQAAEKAPQADAQEAEAEAADAQAMLQAQLRAQAEMLAQHLREQGLTILRRELSLVRQTCASLEKQQRALVLAAGRGAIDRAVDEQLKAAGEVRRRRPPRRPDLETAIRDALKAAVKANAEDAELAAYEAEHRQQAARRKAAVVAVVVAEVDRAAYLDDAERAALAKALEESYRERWRPVMAAFEQHGMAVPDESFLPGLERCVEKALGKERKSQWVAARDEARKAAGASAMQQMQMLGNGVQVQAQVIGAPGQPAVRRVIRRQVQIGAGGMQMQLEVQVGGVAAEQAQAAETAPKEEDK